jgi:hypothetical protein
MTTTALSPAVFTIDPEQAAAYLARCQAREYDDPPPTPEPEGEQGMIPVDWDHEHLHRIEWLLQEAFACGAITSRVPGLTIGFDISDDDMGDPWYKWLVESAALDWCAAPTVWTESVFLGGGEGRGTARVQAVFEEAVSTGNNLAAQSRITSGGPVLAMLCPPGVTSDELLQDLISMAEDAIDHRAPDTADYCGDCVKTERPGAGTDVIFCDDHATDDENARIYTQVKQHLERIQAGKL